MFGLKLTFYTILLIGIPIGLSLLILWFIKKRNYPGKYRIIALFPLLFVAYGIYEGFTRPYSRYQENFKEITGIELPVSSEFLGYTNWGYGTYPAENNSLFHVKVDPEFYTDLKGQLNPSGENIAGMYQEAIPRFEAMFGENFMTTIDYQFSKYDQHGSLIAVIGFFEEDNSLLVFSWKD